LVSTTPVGFDAMTRHGQVLAGRYELGPLLGAGGMASVYRANDRVLERMVAVKVLGAPYDQDSALVERFRHEARSAACLSHPNIVAAFDSGSEGGVHYLVMEYVQGETLADTLRRQGVLEPRRAAEVGRWVCEALAAAHARGLVHRDIKPANVLVSQAGVVKVADFGIASAAATPTHTLTGGGMPVGTAAYLSPEQAQGGPVDARSDLYALGCVLYELLTGVPPFVADSPLMVARQVAEAPAPPSRRNPQVGPELEAVVMTALAKEPARRYQTARAMGQDLERVVGGGAAGAVGLWPAAADPATGALGHPAASSSSAPTVVVAARAARAAARRPGRTRWPLVAGVGLVVLLVAALWWWRGGSSSTVERQAGPAATASMDTTASTTTTSPTTSSTPTTTPARSQPSLPGGAGHAARGGHGGRAAGHDRSGRRGPAAPGRGCHVRCPREGR
jgi:hypothetical protein